MAGDKLPNFEEMSIDDIDAWKVDQKQKIIALQEDIDKAQEVRNLKIQQSHEKEAVKQVIDHADSEGKAPVALAREWLSSDQPGRQTQAELFLGTHRSQSNEQSGTA